MNIDTIVRPNIRALAAYSSARSLYTEGTFFDANENAIESVVTVPGFENLNRYPDPYSKTLRASLAGYAGVAPENVFAGNGSDEVIDLLIRIFVSPRESIVYAEPTYGMYRVAADTAGVERDTLQLESDYKLEAESMLALAKGRGKVIFLCSPNNPTGKAIPLQTIESIAAGFEGIVVVDEAYIEFAPRKTAIDLIKKYERLVVMRTLSKAWGLAGLRIGYCIARPEIIAYLDKVKAPYNLNKVTTAIAVDGLEQRGRMETFRDSILSERERVASKLRSFGITVFDSDANFLLVRINNGSKVAQALAARGFIIRDFSSKKGLEDCVRISIATPQENDQLLETIRSVL